MASNHSSCPYVPFCPFALLPLVDIYEGRMLHRDCMAWPIKMLAGKKLLVRWLKGIQVTTGITSTHHKDNTTAKNLSVVKANTCN